MKDNINMNNKGFIVLPVDKLVKADWNYKLNDDYLHEKLLNNFKRNGQIENIIVRELDTGFYEVVNGNHRLDVIKELNFDKVYCFNLGKISTQQAQRIAVEVNETRFRNDEYSLAKVFQDILNEYDMSDLMESIPFTEKEIEDYINLTNLPIYNIEEPQNKEEDEENKESIVCPKCGYVFTP